VQQHFGMILMKLSHLVDFTEDTEVDGIDEVILSALEV
jgi:hypothetical protein